MWGAGATPLLGGLGGNAPPPLKTFYYLNINWKPLLAAFLLFREGKLSKMLQGEGPNSY